MHHSREHVVCFGRDRILLQTRCQILEQAGYAVAATSDMLTVARHLLGGNVTVLILCQSLTAREVNLISRFHRETHSSAWILAISAGQPEQVPEGAQLHESLKGPAAFLAAVGKLNITSAHIH